MSASSKYLRDAFQQASARVDLFEGETEREPWKKAHEEAMACVSFQETLRVGIACFDLLIRVDEFIREGVLTGKCPHDPKYDEAIRKLFRQWLEPCAKVERTLAGFEKKGFTVDGAAQFRKRHAEAIWMLKPARDAFAHPAIVRARDAAVDALRKGAVAPLGA